MKLSSSSLRRGRVQALLTLAAVVLTASSGVVQAQGTAPAPEEFHAGDRIALTVEGVSVPGQGAPGAPSGLVIADTVTVREGQVLRFPTVGDISLVGVRRRNLEPYLTQQFGKFFRNPVVHATPLIRVAVLGQVGRPGFYSVPSDIPVSEVVMRAGGPTSEADLNKTVVKRGTQTVRGKDAVASALAAGSTLDDIGVAPGDEVVVGEKSHFGFQSILSGIGVGVSLLGLLLYATRR